ncbi:acyl-CoA dehydrogenase family protein [Rhodococcus sp. SGAir0479]|uniref:acyl-CoA dehydrogenase family protein n=1 Tax=Rhodococcus sp. SGAir0479 TaxID=2567884 RepID=UPI0010CD36B2|nr:acyl-CoA dehydrogenase family protein [Rhodococcus sp. SGAir0479]QCQ90957.1 acyl-CoA dehydrogenase [Rhodococcus sp. SGAir0479]
MSQTAIHPTVTPTEAGAWPLPGGGRTGERWRALTDAARTDLVGARLLEAHADATAILHELGGPQVEAGQLWGVWAAEPPEPAVTARQTDAGIVLDGRKLWCSGAHSCTHALVTARRDGERALFAVELSAPGVTPVPDSWHAVGMAASDSGAVDFAAVPAVPVGAPGEYLTRPGFWHGAIGVAACWYGGALAVAQPLRRRAGDDPHRLAHLGAVDAALYAAQSVLDCAAVDLDARPRDRRAAELRARRVRAVVEDTATTVLDRVGRALGAAPLCDDPVHARLVADLTVYLRQSHAERDLAELGSALRAEEADR